MAIEVDRAVNNSGLVGLAGRQVLAAEILGGRPVIVRIEPQTLMFLDPDTRELLRVRSNPLTREQTSRLQGARPAGPPPRPRTEPVTVQRRISATGVISVCRQPVSLGRVHAGRTVPVHVSEHTLAIELDGETRIVRRTTTRPVQNLKANRPHRARATSTELSGSAGLETEQPRWSKTLNPRTLRNLGPARSVASAADASSRRRPSSDLGQLGDAGAASSRCGGVEHRLEVPEVGRRRSSTSAAITIWCSLATACAL